MKVLPRNFSRLGLLVGAFLLAACGNSSDDNNGGFGPVVGGTDVPTSATTSSPSAFTFVNSTAATSNDTAEPLVIGEATLATSDTDEPDPSI